MAEVGSRYLISALVGPLAGNDVAECAGRVRTPITVFHTNTRIFTPKPPTAIIITSQRNISEINMQNSELHWEGEMEPI